MHGLSLASTQPGGGPVMSLELFWGRMRRWLLRRLRPGYVARMRALRAGTCPDCTHDIVDPRDLKFFHAACGYSFPAEADRFAWRGRLGIARAGLAEALVVGGSMLLLAVWSALTWPLLSPVFAALGLWAVLFFRDPRRTPPVGADLILAPADGRVDDIAELESCPWFEGPAVRVGIFLSLFNVHLNRAPIHARVLGLLYSPGERRATYRVGSLEDNEQLVTLFETAGVTPRPFAVRQISGPAARRIVCELKPEQEVRAGQRFGLIKFGSRTELFLPRGSALELRIPIGARVRAGETVLGRWSG